MNIIAFYLYVFAFWSDAPGQQHAGFILSGRLSGTGGRKGTIPVHLHIRRNGSQSDFLSVRGANRRKRRVCRGIRCNFAIVGALIYVVIRNKGRLENFTTKKLLFLAALTLYHGVTSTGVDNAAHFGGFLCGFVLAVLIYRGQKNGRGLKNSNQNEE